MQHAASAAPAARITAAAPRTNAEMRSVRPAATLQPDVFDAPAPIAVAEAVKARHGTGHSGPETRGITPGEDHANPPSPMPAIRDNTNTPAPEASQGHHHEAARGTDDAPAAAAVYSCPMHPEVTSDAPGSCPKCGMALVKKE